MLFVFGVVTTTAAAAAGIAFVCVGKFIAAVWNHFAFDIEPTLNPFTLQNTPQTFIYFCENSTIQVYNSYLGSKSFHVMISLRFILLYSNKCVQLILFFFYYFTPFLLHIDFYFIRKTDWLDGANKLRRFQSIKSLPRLKNLLNIKNELYNIHVLLLSK